MLSSISPLGERARASRWWVTTAAYLLGSAVGGLALGALASLLGGLVPDPVRSSSWSLALVAVLLLVGLGFDSQRGRLDLPSWRRQVDEQLARPATAAGCTAWASVRSSGSASSRSSPVRRRTPSCCSPPSSGDLRAGLAIGAVFGVVRALPSLLMGGVADRAALHTVFVRVERWANPARIVARVTLGARPPRSWSSQ